MVLGIEFWDKWGGGSMEQTSVHIPDNEQYRELSAYIDSVKGLPGPLINVLHHAQEIFGYLPTEVQTYVSQRLNIPLSTVYGVVTFYNFFSTTPRGKFVVNVCLGTACYVRGADRVVDMFRESLNIDVGQTSDDKQFTLSTARCFGACGLAPAVMVNEDVYGNVDRKKVQEIIKKYSNQ